MKKFKYHYLIDYIIKYLKVSILCIIFLCQLDIYGEAQENSPAPL